VNATREDTEDALEPMSSKSTQASRTWHASYLLLHHRSWLARGFVGGVLLGLFIAFTLPPEYHSTVRLMPPDQSSSTMAAVSSMAAKQFGAVESFALEGLGLNKTSGAVFVGILKSRTLQERLNQRFNLTEVYGLPEDLAERKLGLNTDISEDRRSGILTVRVSDSDPARASGLAQAYLEELQRLTVELATSSARRERQFIEERLHEVKKDLDKAAQDLAVWSSANRTYGIEQQKVMVESLAAAQAQMITSETELQALQQVYSANNVRVRAARARVQEVRRQLANLGGGPSADQSVAGLPGLQQLPLLGVKYADLFRRVRVQELVYQTLTQRYEIAKVEEAKEIPTVQALDTARMPLRRQGPPRTLITLLGGFVGVFAVGVALLSRERWHEVPADTPWKRFVLDARDILGGSRFMRKSFLRKSTQDPITLTATTRGKGSSASDSSQGRVRP
jgi:uncharacterized protein involved in exopolysaccharide biosynthesis